MAVDLRYPRGGHQDFHAPGKPLLRVLIPPLDLQDEWDYHYHDKLPPELRRRISELPYDSWAAPVWAAWTYWSLEHAHALLNEREEIQRVAWREEAEAAITPAFSLCAEEPLRPPRPS